MKYVENLALKGFLIQVCKNFLYLFSEMDFMAKKSRFDKGQRRFISETYRATQNMAEVMRLFRERYDETLSKNTISLFLDERGIKKAPRGGPREKFSDLRFNRIYEEFGDSLGLDITVVASITKWPAQRLIEKCGALKINPYNVPRNGNGKNNSYVPEIFISSGRRNSPRNGNGHY